MVTTENITRHRESTSMYTR